MSRYITVNVGLVAGLAVAALVTGTYHVGTPTAVIRKDLNGDNYSDVVVINGTRNRYVFMGQPDGTLVTLEEYASLRKDNVAKTTVEANNRIDDEIVTIENIVKELK